ncbi:hypothetical protein HER10_EVM0005296 [Colletotrichum scovillei]|uniref:uncharacterized protein n=1 Tax=Colletotrichum scovillei TaxID=1209932 RepID=UPI0015C33793|nr:uncharacterized protein HER10_EVM0005296 [Colletotrichum scovillei]KAF4776322.1 hypothetical protein HER10_EVM0005296 [Colletotrichum scovillei]
MHPCKTCSATQRHTRDADVIDKKSQLSQVSDLRQSLQDKHKDDGQDCTTPRHPNVIAGSAAVTAPIRTKEPPIDLRYASSRAGRVSRLFFHLSFHECLITLSR